MKVKKTNNYIPNFWMSVLILLLILLSLWSFFCLEKNEERIAVFAIIGILVTAITSVITVNSTNQKSKEKDYEFMFMKEKIKFLSLFYDYIVNVIKNELMQGKSSNKSSQNKVDNLYLDEYFEFKKGLMNWGSERIIRDFFVYDKMIQDKELSVKEKVIEIDAFLRSIRIELNNNVSNELSLFSLLLSVDARKELGL